MAVAELPSESAPSSTPIVSHLRSFHLKMKQQELLLRAAVLALVYVLAFIICHFSVLRYEFMIHEFDPYFNYRTTLYLTSHSFSDFWNWFDAESWYPFGRVVGPTLYPGLMLTAAALHGLLLLPRLSVHIRDVCVLTTQSLLLPFPLLTLLISPLPPPPLLHLLHFLLHLPHRRTLRLPLRIHLAVLSARLGSQLGQFSAQIR